MTTHPGDGLFLDDATAIQSQSGLKLSTRSEAEYRAAGFQQYRCTVIAEMRPYMLGEWMNGISISKADMEAGSPKSGDMIARNPKNHTDQWLVAAKYFADNYTPAHDLITREE